MIQEIIRKSVPHIPASREIVPLFTMALCCGGLIHCFGVPTTSLYIFIDTVLFEKINVPVLTDSFAETSSLYPLVGGGHGIVEVGEKALKIHQEMSTAHEDMSTSPYQTNTLPRNNCLSAASIIRPSYSMLVLDLDYSCVAHTF